MESQTIEVAHQFLIYARPDKDYNKFTIKFWQADGNEVIMDLNAGAAMAISQAISNVIHGDEQEEYINIPSFPA
jgi:predicted proteasome-type protease